MIVYFNTQSQNYVHIPINILSAVRCVLAPRHRSGRLVCIPLNDRRDTILEVDAPPLDFATIGLICFNHNKHNNNIEGKRSRVVVFLWLCNELALQKTNQSPRAVGAGAGLTFRTRDYNAVFPFNRSFTRCLNNNYRTRYPGCKMVRPMRGGSVRTHKLTISLAVDRVRP